MTKTDQIDTVKQAAEAVRDGDPEGAATMLEDLLDSLEADAELEELKAANPHLARRR